jgi:hypothetical protein
MGKMVATPISVFYCPSRRPVASYPWLNTGNYNFEPPELAAKTDYAGSMGSVGVMDSEIPGPKTLAEAETYKWQWSGPAFMTKCAIRGSQSPTGETGIIFQRSEIKLRQVEDGTSSTYLIGEKNLNSCCYELSVDPQGSTIGNDDQGMYNGYDRDTLRSSLVWFKGFENKGPPQWPAIPDTYGKNFNWSFGGPHPNGWMALFCDGSVHYLPFEMDGLIHQRLGDRLDGETVDMAGL